MAQLLHITRAVEGQVSGLIGRLEEYGDQVVRLRAAHDEVAPTVQRVRDLRDAVHSDRYTRTRKPLPRATDGTEGETAASAADETADLKDTLRHLAEVIDERVATAVSGYQKLLARLAELGRRDRRDAR